MTTKRKSSEPRAQARHKFRFQAAVRTVSHDDGEAERVHQQDEVAERARERRRGEAHFQRCGAAHRAAVPSARHGRLGPRVGQVRGRAGPLPLDILREAQPGVDLQRDGARERAAGDDPQPSDLLQPVDMLLFLDGFSPDFHTCCAVFSLVATVLAPGGQRARENGGTTSRNGREPAG